MIKVYRIDRAVVVKITICNRTFGFCFGLGKRPTLEDIKK